MYKVVRVVSTNNRYGVDYEYNEHVNISEPMAIDMAARLNKERGNSRTSYEVRRDR